MECMLRQVLAVEEVVEVAVEAEVGAVAGNYLMCFSLFVYFIKLVSSSSVEPVEEEG